MADVNATFNYDANFGSALSQIKALSRELSFLNNSFNSLDKNARVLRNDIANTFSSAVGQIGGFSSRTVTITSDLDNFGKSLDRSKLKLRDYYREASRAFSANSNARKLAEDQVRRTKGQLVELGMDAEGRRKGMLVTPMRLDMTDMNNQLQVARKQFDIFNRLIQDGATSLINWGKNTQWAGRQLTVGLTVPMTIFASTTIKAFNDVDKELTRFQKVYGADLVGTTKEASMEMRNAIQALAIDIAGSYGIAAKETAALAADLAATGLEGKKLTDSIKQTTRLAVLGEIDRQDAMQTTLSLQNAFNMSTKELAESIDFLNAVENQTSVSLQDLTVAIPKVGPVIESLGGDVKDLSVLLVAMKEGGINAAEGANALKSGLASLINPTKSASAIAKQYGIDLQGIVTRNKGQLMPTLLEFQASLSTLDDFGKAKIIEQLFGKYQFARISALFDNLNAQGSQTVEVMKLMGASSEELAKIAQGEIKTLTESTSMRFQRSMEAIKASLLPVGEVLTRSVIPFMEKFANFMERVVEVGRGLPEPVKNFLKFATGLTAIAGPVVMITGVLANFLGYVTKGAMGFVNLGRRLAGLPTKQFSLLDDEQIAAAKATDTLTVSIQNQASAMTKLVALMRDYNSTLVAQRAATPGAFSSTPLVTNPRRGGVPPRGTPIRRQEGSWVPGSGSGDKVKALLEPGEFVVNRNAAKQYGGVLEDMNNGTPRFQRGGPLRAMAGIMVPTSPFRRAPGPGFFRRTDPEIISPRQPEQLVNTPGRPLRYGNESEWENSYPFRMPTGQYGPALSPDVGIYLKDKGKRSNISYRRQFQARQADEQVSVITSRLQNASSSQELVDSIPEIIRNVQVAKGIPIREPGELKPFPADSTFPMPGPLNTLYNDIRPGKRSDPTMFSSILTKIADSSQLTLEQKKSLFALVSKGDAPANPELVKFMSTVFKDILDQGLPAKYSQNVAAKMALAATVPAEFKKPLKPMSDELGNIIGQSRDRSSSGMIANQSLWTKASKKLGLESLPLSAQSTANDNAAKLLAKTLNISNKDAMDLINSQKVGEFHVSHAQSGGVIRAMRGIKMPEKYASKLSTVRQSMSATNAEAMASKLPIADLGNRQSRIGGFSSAIPGVNGVYEINGQRYVVKGHDTEDSALAEANMARITRDVFGLKTPNQEVVRVRHPETGDLLFAVRSPYDEAFAKTTGRFTEDSAFDQLVASVARRDKDLQADNLFDNIVSDVGQAGIMSKASQPRTKTGPTNSALEQLAINLGMTKGGARSHGAEAWNAATANMTDAQIIARIKESAAKARAKLSSADIPEDFKYIAKDLDDIASADLAPFVAHLRTVFPKEKKPATAAALAKKEEQKILEREERESALAAGFPEWALQKGGMPKKPNLSKAMVNQYKDYKKNYYDKKDTYANNLNFDNMKRYYPKKDWNKPLTKEEQELFNPWIDEKQELRKMRSSKSAEFTEKMSKLPKGLILDRATTLNPGKSTELPMEQQIMLINAIKNNDLQSVIGKKLEINGIRSFSTAAAGYKGSFGFFRGPKDSVGISSFHEFNKMKRKNRKESDSEYGLEDIFIKYISSGKTMGRDITRDSGGGSLNEIIANNLSGKIVSVATNVITKAPEFIVKGLQKGGSPFVPGSGDGDRVPALLEPGEFVVNKKAAKKYGGLLHDINFNQAPRFQSGGIAGMNTPDTQDMSGMGGMKGMKTGAVSGAAMAIGMVASMAGLPPAINNAIMGFSALTGVMSAFQMIMMKNNATAAASGAGGFLQKGVARQAAGKAQMSAAKATGGVRGAAGMLGGAGKMAAGFLLGNPIGLAIVAGLAVAAGAWIKYRKEVEEAKKATQQAFSVGEQTAAAYGIELTKVTDKLKENAEITNQIGINANKLSSTVIVSEEKKAAILADNADFLADLKEKESAASATSPARGGTPSDATQEKSNMATDQIKSQLLTKFASLRQQGVSAQDANEIITTLARDAGDETISALLDLRPTLEKMNGDNLNEVFKVAQQAQLDGLKNLRGVGSADAFKEGIKASMDVIQYAPPEDQLEALNNLITNMKGFDATQLKLAGTALAEAAAVTYGTESDIGSSLQSLFKSGDASQIETGMNIDTLMKANALTANQVFQIEVAVAEDDIDKVNSIIDPILKDRNLKINMTVDMQEDANKRIEEINKEITAQQAKFDGQMIANDNAVEAENKRYENAQKAHQKFIKEKQDEIEAINKSADAYIKALQDEQRADSFAQQQRDTATGGLKALASGDVFGFVQSQQEMAGAAQQFGFESEIKAIDERRQAAVDAKQEEIKAQQELAATEDERHQNRLKALEAQRVAHIKANGDVMKGFQSQQAALQEISGMSGTAFTGITEGFATVDVEANKVGASAAAVNFLLANPDATVEQAIEEGRKYMESKAQSPGANYQGAGGNYGSNGAATDTKGGPGAKLASGGYVSGAGGPTSDLIDARLSNGEYVVQASAVDEYGVEMMDSINKQRFATGGLVKPIGYGPNTRYPYGDSGHLGTDFSGPSGAYVVASHGGTIKKDEIYKDPNGTSSSNPAPGRYYGDGLASYGRLLTITGNGWTTKYAHLAKFIRTSGSVAQGEEIALSGNSGNSSGPHLHFEVFKGSAKSDNRINPLSAISGSYTGKTGTEDVSKSDTQLEEKIEKIAPAFGTTAETYNKVKSQGIMSLIGRKFGGSMTMNKPYMVGENGPEVVMPYGSGGKVVPIKYNVPAMASGGIINGSMASSSPQINVTVNGVNDPKQAADRAAQLINSEMNRRKFSRSIG
jgi:TP901 family phage tail tape measure protein